MFNGAAWRLARGCGIPHPDKNRHLTARVEWLSVFTTTANIQQVFTVYISVSKQCYLDIPVTADSVILFK